MRVYFYDLLQNKLQLSLPVSDFSDVNIEHSIDGISSLRLGITNEFAQVPYEITPFDNIYIEDDQGRIIFGGVISGYNVQAKSGQITAYDHRFLFKRLIADKKYTISEDDNLLEKVQEVFDAAQQKRKIPIVFDRDRSAINEKYTTDLSFKVGDKYAKILKKIVKSTQSRWAIEYEKTGNSITGHLFVRSIFGVTPEGVGVSHSVDKSEDGSRINLFYKEGSQANTINNFTFRYDMAKMNTRTKVGIKTDGQKEFVDVPPNGFTARLQGRFGITESYINDYKVDSKDAAQTIGDINQNLPVQELSITLARDFKKYLRTGDRVSLEIEVPLLYFPGEISSRIDGITYVYREGGFERQLKVNVQNPKKRIESTAIIDQIEKVNERLDDLDKDYLENI